MGRYGEGVHLAPGDVILVRGVLGTVEAQFTILGADEMAAQGYLEEVWDAKAAAAGDAWPWPVVDILDDGRLVARRVRNPERPRVRQGAETRLQRT